MIKNLRNELCKSVFGRCVWIALLLTVGSWVIGIIINLVVWFFSVIAGLFGLIFGSQS